MARIMINSDSTREINNMNEFYEIARIIAWIVMTPIFLLVTWMAIGGMMADYQRKKKEEEEYLRSREEWIRTHVRRDKGGEK